MRKIILTVFVLSLLLIGVVSRAAEVVLYWDPSIDAPYLIRYSIYTRTDPDKPYVSFSENQTENNLVDTVEADILTFTAIVPNGTNYFVVTATDTRELESDWSNEVKHVSSALAPAPPRNVSVE